MKKPIKPIKPEKYINYEKEVSIDSDSSNLQYLLNLCQKQSKNKLSYKDITLKLERSYDWTVVCLTFNVKEENKKYNKEIEKYNKKMIEYKKKLKEWKIFEKNNNIQNTKNQIASLQQKLKKLEKTGV